MKAPRKRGTNVFWSGEKFMLRAETEGSPARVTVKINTLDSQGQLRNTGYTADLTNTGKKTAAGAKLWDGALWENSMINKWGRKAPQMLIFVFTSYYSGNLTKEHTVNVIVDSYHDYWQLHRLW